ncbi:MAG: DUF5916 domain-containing protein [Gemmatimonadales bacterium]
MALAPRQLVAMRTGSTPPAVDGRLDEPGWCAAPAVTDFVQTSPSPGALATMPTVARVLYDDDAVYIAVRAFDPHARDIASPYLRRDDENNSDWIFVEIDSRYDRRSGFSFGVNPRGVQVDGTWSNDVDYDAAWNGVWASAAQIDSAGWAVELRIPFSQLALQNGTPGTPLTWGINIYRSTRHAGESSNWSPRLPTAVGVVSHFNVATGLITPPRHRDVEVVPYVSTTGSEGTTTIGAGGDLRWRPAPMTTMAISLLPDFGQVEADPSQINLTTFETFLTEQRPLFVNDAALFQPLTGLSYQSRGTSFAQEAPFYSRRIGAPPHGRCPTLAADCQLPTATTVLAAVRLTTRTANGWSGGLFQALTSAEHATFDSTSSGTAVAPDHDGSSSSRVEPVTSFTAARALREFHQGRSAVGAIATFVNRRGLRDGLDSVLTSNAMVVGVDGRTRTADDEYELSGFAMTSRVGGSPTAIAALRREPRHNSSRDDIDRGTTAAAGDASLSGVTAEAQLKRLQGRFQWGLAGRLVDRGFEANDVGFQRNGDWVLAAGSWDYQRYRPGHVIRRWSIGSSQIGAGWTTSGQRRSTTANLNGAITLKNYWGASVSVTHEFAAFDPEVLRGGPALLLPSDNRVEVTAHTDSRRRWLGSVTLTGSAAPAIGSHHWAISPNFTAFLTDRLQLELLPSFSHGREGWQYAGQGADSVTGARRYALGALTETDVSLTLRATYAASRDLSLQLYAQPFVASGAFAGYLEVIAPAATTPDARVAPLAGGFSFDNPAFSERNFHLNLLMRWEFHPGSTLFVVWTQQRTEREVSDFSLASDLRKLWHAPAANAVQAKVSYWIGH